MVRDDFNITEMRAEGQDLPSPFIVTIPASRPVSSTHVTSIDLYTRNSQSASSRWQFAQHWHTPPCTFDKATNRTGFKMLELSNPVTFAWYVAIVVTSTESGSPGRVAEVNIFGGLAPELRDTGGQGLSRLCKGTIALIT